ncbi:MAG: arylesterase [Alphaproteobacteria bacterium]|nr:arylesterase [Alphaproteobacteria bacterium]
MTLLNRLLSYSSLAAIFTRCFGLGAAIACLALGSSSDAETRLPVIVVFGDSLTAGYGLAPGDSFPVQLERSLKARGVAAKVVNAGVSGDTTAGGRTRLDWVLTDAPDLVIVELGGNDALRGVDPGVTRDNLDAILAKLTARGIKTLLTGMRAPPNYGTDYGRAFEGLFHDLAQKYLVAFYPFFLDGVAARPELNQNDGIHPTRAGVAVIVNRILPTVLPLIAPKQ